jgi:hypothetical protein
MEPINKILCPSCLTENNPNDNYCCKCNASIGQQSTIDPVLSAVAEGRAISEAIREPHKLIVVIGIWMLFGAELLAWAIIFYGTVITDLFNFGDFNIIPFILFAVFTFIYLYFCILTTRNYLRYKRNRPD